jgi:hypothetical protein
MRIQDITFPPVGKDLKFVVCCEGQVMAGFPSREQAEVVRAMYSSPTKGQSREAAIRAVNRKWTVEIRG